MPYDTFAASQLTEASLREAMKQLFETPAVAEAPLPSHASMRLAERLLAESLCPDSLKEFGKRHNIPTFAEATWMAGFVQGMRIAMMAQQRETPNSFICGWCGETFCNEDTRIDHLQHDCKVYRRAFEKGECPGYLLRPLTPLATAEVFHQP